MKQVMRFPYGAAKEVRVIESDDVVFELFERYLVVTLRALVELPVDYDDPCMGVKQVKRHGNALILRSAIEAVEWSWDDKDERYEFRVFAGSGSQWAYNCVDKATAQGNAEILRKWLIGE